MMSDLELLEWGWAILASVDGGCWSQQAIKWRQAAAKWRDDYHKRIVTKDGLMLEKAYCKLIGVDIAAILRDAGWCECFCHCAADVERPAGYCCEKCGGRMTYWEPPKQADDFMVIL